MRGDYKMNRKQKINRILFIFAIILLSMFFQKITNAETFQPVGIGTNNNRNNNRGCNYSFYNSFKIGFSAYHSIANSPHKYVVNS